MSDEGPVRRVAVIGGGTMGVGIAHRFAVAGAEIRLVDMDLARAEGAVAAVAATLQRAAELGKIEVTQAAAATARVVPVASVGDIDEGLDLIVEAVFEEPALKRRLLAEAEQRRPGVLASNTSSISIDALAAPLQEPTRFWGMHFFNPVWAIHLVEVVRGTATSEETLDRVLQLVAFLGMEAAVVRDAPGFASSRLGIALGLEAMRMVEEGVARPEDIDRVMELGYRYPMGPLRTGDLVGLDVRLAVADYLSQTYGERFEPPGILRRMVAEGRLGKKSGRGFYQWPD